VGVGDGRVSLHSPRLTPEATVKTIIDIAHEAGGQVRAGFGVTGRVDYKGTVNPVTETDRATEELIVSRLRQAFPGCHIHGEEAGSREGEDGGRGPRPVWLVDPLDGTNNFAHGFPHFSVSIGQVVDGRGQVGVVYDPLRDETFWASRGGGAFRDGERIHVSAVRELSDAFLATGFPYSRRVVADNNSRVLDYFLRRSQGVRRVGSAALDLAYVACGRFDGYWEPGLGAWDVAAGLLLVEEAGGRVSDFDGGTDRILTEGEVVVSNGLIHGEMLRVLREGAGAPHPDYGVMAGR